MPADLDLLNNTRASGVRVIGDLELAAPFLKGKTMGITGSNGKTTTTALTGHILRETRIACQVGGNIGTPPAAIANRNEEMKSAGLRSADAESRAVAETGSNNSKAS